jgi:hypothetical protein
MTLIRTDQFEEAIRSLEHACNHILNVCSDAYEWKWILLSLHAAAQSVMTLALQDGNGFQALSGDSFNKWNKAHIADTDYPKDFLDHFLSLYTKCKNDNSFHIIGALAFNATNNHDDSFFKLNEYRNRFIHFNQQLWMIEDEEFPCICIDVLDLIRHFSIDYPAIIWRKDTQRERVEKGIRILAATLAQQNDQVKLRFDAWKNTSV